MARQRILSDKQWDQLMAAEYHERAIVRHFTLSRDDIDLIATKRGDHNLLTRAVLKGGRPPMWEARNAPELVGFFKACDP